MYPNGICKWYEARELLDPDEWPARELDLMGQVLVRNLQRISSKSLPVSQQSDCLFQAENCKQLLLERFKPVHRAEATQEMPIFRGATIGPLPRDVGSPSRMRNIKSAEMILKLQQRLSNFTKRLSCVDGRLRQIAPIPSPSDEHNAAADEDGQTSCSSSWHLVIPASLFWFAWPIVLLTALNRRWPQPWSQLNV